MLARQELLPLEPLHQPFYVILVFSFFEIWSLELFAWASLEL
jgi:hypothetical protein